MSWRKYTFSIPSGALVSEIQQMQPASRITIILSNITSFNNGVGNMAFRMRGGLTATDTNFAIFKLPDDSRASISTETSKGVYGYYLSGGVAFHPMPFMQFSVLTAPTGTNANQIDVITYTETGS